MDNIHLIEHEIELTEGLLDRLFGRETKKPETPVEPGEIYKYSRVGPNLYVGPKPPRFYEGKIKKGVGPVYGTKELSGMQDQGTYDDIRERGVIYGLANSEDLGAEAPLFKARELKSGPGWSFEDNEEQELSSVSQSQIDEILGALKHAAESIHRDMGSKPVLVTCVMGQNRSASAAALALVLDGTDPRAAIDQVRSSCSNHLRGRTAIANKLFERYIMLQPAGGPLLEPSEIPIEKLIGEENLSEWMVRQLVRELLR
jgi:protein-tyrosine phosphatase